MSEICHAIHTYSHNLPRLLYPFNASSIPQNGVYLLFEQRERAHEGDRIIRVGTHTGANQLPSRISQHFIKENKDRSIFRKNIGRALMNKVNDPYLEVWNLDLTTRANKEKYSERVQTERQKLVEAAVSDYIRSNISFVFIPVSDKSDRIQLESRLISAIAQCSECRGSSTWLGQYSPIAKIMDSGLWQVNELFKDPLTFAEFKVLIANSTG